VLDRFADVPGAADGRMLDLRRVIDARLTAAGVTQIRHLDRCTSCHPDLYFSHRRDDGITGRQAGLAVLDGR
jgi:copper oxidase (laccase) domain-containing protein